MRRRRRSKARSRPMRVIRLWTYPQAEKALPYIRSVTRSLRQHWLDARGRRQDLVRLDRRAGILNRETLVERSEAETEHSKAEDRFTEALHELMDMDVFLLDPVQGVALIPFNKDDALAWFVFDLFENEGLKSWRFHEDALETRRPIDEAVKAPPPASA